MKRSLAALGGLAVAGSAIMVGCGHMPSFDGQSTIAQNLNYPTLSIHHTGTLKVRANFGNKTYKVQDVAGGGWTESESAFSP